MYTKKITNYTYKSTFLEIVVRYFSLFLFTWLFLKFLATESHFFQQSELDPRMSDAAKFWEINGVKFNAEATTLHLDVCV